MAGEGSDFYLRAAAAGIDPEISPGGSGYFSTPVETLDPKLFTGDQFRPDTRRFLVETLYDYWETKYTRPRDWSTVWIAGSGISYQWAASRGNGDLDILMGVDFPAFFDANREYVGLSEKEMADQINAELHAELWPKTANWEGYEVTYYVNPGATDIRDINPYAAYNLTTDEWTVRPPDVSANPREDHSAQNWTSVNREIEAARGYVAKFTAARDAVAAATPDSPAWRNAMVTLRQAASAAGALFDDIHTGRKQAFSSTGTGYGDYYNFRWQAHKDAGTSTVLNDIRKAADEADGQSATDLYGRRLATADEVRTQAALWASARRS